MARFLKHEACPSCGSSDARGIYEDGSSYCFSCGKYTSGTISPYTLKQEAKNEKHVKLPDDATKEYGADAIEWVGKYGITVADLLTCHNPIYYSKQRNQLIFSWEINNEVVAWQARNLTPVSKGKRYFTQGDVNNLLTIYFSNSVASNCLVLVEDCLSALKCSSFLGRDETREKPLGFDAMPLLGSGISNLKLSRLRHLYGRLIVFLDPDMFHKSVDIANRAQALGFSTSVVKQDKDPKEFTYTELNKILK